MLSVNSEHGYFCSRSSAGPTILAMVDLGGRFFRVKRSTIFSDLERRSLTSASVCGPSASSIRRSPSKVWGLACQDASTRTQRVLLAPNLNWHEFDLKDALEEVSGLQVEWITTPMSVSSRNFGSAGCVA